MIDVLVVGAVGNALKSWELRLKSAVFTLLVVGYATAHVLTRGNQAKILVGLQSAILVKYYFCYRKATRGIGFGVLAQYARFVWQQGDIISRSISPLFQLSPKD